MVYLTEEPNPTRERFFRALGLDPALVYSCTQVHSRDVRVIEGVNAGPQGGALFGGRLQGDGLISREAVYLAVTVADCLPVFLLDTEGLGRRNIPFAVLHSGWRGTGIVLTALAMMNERWHTRPEAVAAVLGPCIQGCCYRVNEERARSFEAEFGGSGGAYPLGPVVKEFTEGENSQGGFSLSLQAANARLLANAGVRNIAVCTDCTFTDERLGSFRREGAGAYTRMAALAGRL
jgi:YfiH family protein